MVIDLLGKETKSTDDPILADCMILLNGFQAFKISHIFHGGNSGADWLANLGCCVASATFWEDCFPFQLLALSERDVRVSFFRL